MTFVIGRGFAEVQILKKKSKIKLLNRLEYFDKGIAKWHLSSVEV